MNPQIEAVARKIFDCNHIVPETGEDAFWPVGKYGEGYEQCVLCGEVKCTNPPDETNFELADVKGRI